MGNSQYLPDFPYCFYFASLDHGNIWKPILWCIPPKCKPFLYLELKKIISNFLTRNLKVFLIRNISPFCCRNEGQLHLAVKYVLIFFPKIAFIHISQFLLYSSGKPVAFLIQKCNRLLFWVQYILHNHV